MEVRDNSSVIRVPLADPTCKKDGLLHFALPRECVQCEEEPQFYATSDTVMVTAGDAAPAAFAPAAAPEIFAPSSAPLGDEPSDVGTLLDLALDGLRDARRGLTSVGTDLKYADFTVHRTQSEFARLDGPLGVAEADTPARNVSDAGRQLDFNLWGARNGLHDCQTGMVRANGGAQNATEILTETAGHLAAARQFLNTADPAVGKLLAEAETSVGAALANTRDMTAAVAPCAIGLREADNGLLFSDQQVGHIKNDRPGVDVSGAARELRRAVDAVSARLVETDNALDVVRGHLNPADAAAERAETALESLREQLARG